MSIDVDCAVLGGGCAGLSLAERLASAGGRAPRALVLDARTRYREDRTWSFWRVEETRFDAAIAAAWERVRVRAEARDAVVGCAGRPYVMLPSGAFYERCLGALGDRVRLRAGVRVVGVAPRSDGSFTVETDAGAIRARHVVDTRPAGPPKAGAATLWQSFAGREIACDADVFDPTVADLMDFEPGDEGRIGFVYVLPRDCTRALVEYTIFSETPLGPAALAADLDRAVARRVKGAAVATLRTEHGVLPMGMRAPRPTAGRGHVRAGLAGGAARPSSGYAFLRIQRWAQACAAALIAGDAPVGQAPDPAPTRLMDRVFLRALARSPKRGPEMFLRLFARTPPERLVRFLSDRGTVADHLALACALPIGPFLREAPFGVAEEMRERVALRAARAE